MWPGSLFVTPRSPEWPLDCSHGSAADLLQQGVGEKVRLMEDSLPAPVTCVGKEAAGR